MKLRSITHWRTAAGSRRYVKLYRAWKNVHNRVAGRTKDGCAKARWKGLAVGWSSWSEFRTWALQNGFRNGLVLERKDPSLGYGPDNCEWITAKENARRAATQHTPRCKCWWCKNNRKAARGL